MAIIFQDGKRIDPRKVPEGTRYDPRRGPGYGWANIAGEDESLFGHFCGEDVTVETRGGRWTIVSRERER